MKNIVSFSLILSCLTLVFSPGYSQTTTKEINFEGLKIIYKKTPKQVITASLFIKGGTANVTDAQQGLEVLALSLALDGGTKKLNKDDFSAKADKLGTSFAAAGSTDYSTMTMTCLKENFTPSWEMFNSAVFEPAMDESEFKVLKDQMIAQAKQRESDPDAFLRKMANDSLFGGTDYAKTPEGTPASLETLTLEDAKKYYQTLLGKSKCYLVVVGNIDEKELLQNIKGSLAKLPAGKPAKTPTFKSVNKPGVIIKDRTLATNYILGIMNAPKYNSADGPLFDFAMRILYDRYFVELRTKRSLTYAPSAAYSKRTIQQPLTNLYISTIDPKQSLQVMTEIINTVKKEGFTEKEVKDKKKSFLTRYYMTNESSAAQASQLGFCEASGNWKLFDEINNKINLVKLADLNKTFNKYMTVIDWIYLGKQDQVSREDFKQLTK